MLFGNDGSKNNLFFTTNENEASRFKLTTEIKPTPQITLGGNIELGVILNPSDAVNQMEHVTAPNIDYREAELFIKSEKLGELRIGKGSTASDDTAETDLSDTDMAANSSVSDFGGGLYFRSPNSKDYSENPEVVDVFNNLDGLSRDIRVRYDTPSLFGTSLSGSAIQDSRADIALRFCNKIKSTEIEATTAYSSLTEEGDTKGNILDGSISILFHNGISTTLAMGDLLTHIAARDNPYYTYFKLGYQKEMLSIGRTSRAVDRGTYNNFAQNGDRGKTYSAIIAQNFKSYNTALYTGYRCFRLIRTGSHFNNINVVYAGAIVTF